MPGRHDDQTLLLADVGRKALRQVKLTVQMLLEKRMDPVRAEERTCFRPASGRMTTR